MLNINIHPCCQYIPTILLETCLFLGDRIVENENLQNGGTAESAFWLAAVASRFDLASRPTTHREHRQGKRQSGLNFHIPLIAYRLVKPNYATTREPFRKREWHVENRFIEMNFVGTL